MKTHEEKKNYSNYVETAITAIGIIAMALTSIVLAGIKLVELIIK